MWEQTKAWVCLYEVFCINWDRQQVSGWYWECAAQTASIIKSCEVKKCCKPNCGHDYPAERHPTLPRARCTVSTVPQHGILVPAASAAPLRPAGTTPLLFWPSLLPKCLAKWEDGFLSMHALALTWETRSPRPLASAWLSQAWCGHLGKQPVVDDLSCNSAFQTN